MLKLPGKTIRTRLLISFVLMALLSAVGVTISAVVIGYANGNQQIIDRLESVVARKALEIQVYLDSLDSELVRALNEPYAPERANVVLDLANRHKFYDFYTSALRQRLIRFTAQSDLLESITLVSRDERPILSTDPIYEVDLCLPPDLFQQGLEAPAVQISYPPASDTAISAPCNLILTASTPRLITVRPVSGATDPVAGLVVGTTSTDRLETLLNDRQGIGETGRLYIVTQTGYTAFAPPGTHASAELIAQIEREGHAVYDNADGSPVVGVWREIPELDALVVAEQHLSEGFGAVYTNLSINLTLAVIAVLIAIVVAYVITRSITQPLIELLTTVKQISGGDLDRRVPEIGSDEVGELAVAFNAMTARLRDLINHLDEQVEARTRALHQVALQLETSAEVSRKLTSILDIDNLLGRVVELIREAFGYYQVLIFLLDAETNRLIIRASTGDMAKRPQTLDILQPGLNAEAARTGRAVLVNDVSTNDQFLADPTLPDTRSELVIPLKVNDKMIGTLDIHSVNQNQFTQEDVRVNQSLGDQIAIAIENAHLYERSRELAIIEERTRLARDLHDSVIQSLYSLSLLAEGWRRRVETDSSVQVEELFDRVGTISHQALKEMRLLVYELRPLELGEDGLLGALHQRLGVVESRAGMDARLRADNLLELAPEIEEALYWIAVEALNNTLKHASATQVSVLVQSSEEYVTLKVIDNGCGFDPATLKPGGLGLTTMRERSEKLGGTLDVTSRVAQGTTVEVVIPTGKT